MKLYRLHCTAQYNSIRIRRSISEFHRIRFEEDIIMYSHSFLNIQKNVQQPMTAESVEHCLNVFQVDFEKSRKQNQTLKAPNSKLCRCANELHAKQVRKITPTV